MTEKEFLADLTDLMDTEEKIVMETHLSDVEEWDSLSHVAFMALVATKASGKVAPTDVKTAQTVRDLYHLLYGVKR